MSIGPVLSRKYAAPTEPGQPAEPHIAPHHGDKPFPEKIRDADQIYIHVDALFADMVNLKINIAFDKCKIPRSMPSQFPKSNVERGFIAEAQCQCTRQRIKQCANEGRVFFAEAFVCHELR